MGMQMDPGKGIRLQEKRFWQEMPDVKLAGADGSVFAFRAADAAAKRQHFDSLGGYSLGKRGLSTLPAVPQRR